MKIVEKSVHPGFSQNEKRQVCYEVLTMEQTSSLKRANIIEKIAKKYNTSSNAIYVWNKEFGYIFKNKLFSTDDKIKILMEVENLIKNENLLTKDAFLQISNKYDVSSWQLYAWNRELKVLNTRQRRTDEYMLFILDEIKQQTTDENLQEVIFEFAKKLNISINTIYHWNRKLNVFKTRKQYTDEDIIVILNEIKKRGNNENLYEIVAEFADVLKVSAQTIYSWNKKFNIFPKQQRFFDEDFKKKVLQEFNEIGFTADNIRIIAEKYNITIGNIYNWNRFYQMFDTKNYKKGALEKLKAEIIEKLETDKEFKSNLLENIRQKSK